MATVVLTAVGSALGQTLLPAGVSAFGATVSGAAIGAAVGGAVGRVADAYLFSGGSAPVEGPRLSALQVMTSSEGAPMPRVYGAMRLAGQVIWATHFSESTSVSGERGGKSGGGETRTYSYSVSLAVGLCEGPITGVGRIWADGQPLDASGLTWRLHRGSEDQPPDSLITAVEGAGNAPAYRGLAYLVFEDLPLGQFGNRVPQFTVEAQRGLNPLGAHVKAVTMIPGGTEFGYHPEPHRQDLGGGRSVAENSHNAQGLTDWALALDQLADDCPNCESVALVVSWFGDDLRAGHCKVAPKVEDARRRIQPAGWRVSGLTREQAGLVSRVNDRPAFGGTPDDDAVIAAIGDLKRRGYAVTFYPFLMMDIPADNTLPDPLTGAAGQGAYPWRGRITCTAGVQGTAAAADEVEAFFGAAQSADFVVRSGAPQYAGAHVNPGYRRMILHYAHLCRLAGGVEAFLIGSELRGLTQARSARRQYPAVEALRRLASEAAAILPADVKVSYAADWSEFAPHQVPGGDLNFHLDPLWADPHIDFIGIDWYQPLTDWRDGNGHLDAQAQAAGPHDLAYLKANMTGGENFDWYYASADARDRQQRTPIADESHGEHWVFRSKDLAGWWSGRHYNRANGRHLSSPTAWRPRSKPIWFTEAGCPAIDRGANQPNVFHDAKSAESALPHYSRGHRDDLAQARCLEAVIAQFDPAHPDHDPDDNPRAPGGDPMVSPGRIHLWTWDARPAPYFPQLSGLWSDAPNWHRGHWISGRLKSAPLASLVASILDDYGFHSYDVSALSDRGDVVHGFVLDRVMSAREALDPLLNAFSLDVVESGEVIRFLPRGGGPVRDVDPGRLVLTGAGDTAPLELTRIQEQELPGVLHLTYVEQSGDYRQASVSARRPGVGAARVAAVNLPMVLDQQTAQGLAERWLAHVWQAREHAVLRLPSPDVALEPGDRLRLGHEGRMLSLRIVSITDTNVREIQARSVAAGAQPAPGLAPMRALPPVIAEGYGAPLLRFLDLPLLRGDEAPHAPHVAAAADPWPGGVAIYRGATGDDFALDSVLRRPAVMGQTLDVLPPGAPGRWIGAPALRVKLWRGVLAAASARAVLGGANIAAVSADGRTWEVIQFLDAELVEPQTWRLLGLLRGQAGTPSAASLPAGAGFVLLDGAPAQLKVPPSVRGLSQVWRYGPHALPLDDARYISETRAFAGLGLAPLPPVHLCARRLVGGALEVRWIRRTRRGGDDWSTPDAPLAEERELYEVDVLSETRVQDTVRVTEPVAQVNAAPPVRVRVHQISAVFGRGRGAEARFAF